MNRKIYRGSGNILVVDDEEIVRFLIEEMMTELGYTVQSYSSALDAITYYKENKNDIELVLLDMNMPELDGLETFKRLKTINSNVKAIILSGYSQEEQIEGALELGIIDYLTKPIDIYSLSKTVYKNIK